MGKITIFSKLIINMFIGVVLAQFLGVPEAYGAIGGAVVPLAAGAFMPQGALCEGVFTEIWTGELVKQLRGGMTASWLDGVSDYSAAVNNEVIHLVDVGGDPDVLINNTTYPIAAQELEDGDIALGLDKFQTKKTVVSDDTLFAISYDIIGSVIERHGDAINIAKFKKAAHAVAPQSNTDTTPVIPTTGEKDANGRQKLTRKDILSLRRALDAKGYPATGRRLVLCSDHVNDLLEEDQNFGTSITTILPERLSICMASMYMNLRTARSTLRKEQRLHSRLLQAKQTTKLRSVSTLSVCSVHRVVQRCITRMQPLTLTTRLTK